METRKATIMQVENGFTVSIVNEKGAQLSYVFHKFEEMVNLLEDLFLNSAV